MSCVSDGAANGRKAKKPFYRDSDRGLSPSVITSQRYLNSCAVTPYSWKEKGESVVSSLERCTEFFFLECI